MRRGAIEQERSSLVRLPAFVPVVRRFLISTLSYLSICTSVKCFCRARMLRLLSSVVALGSTLICPFAAMSIEKSDDIDTNRPSFCQSPIVVPRGSVQLENGGLYQHFPHGKTFFDIPEQQLRLGILRNTELQMSVPFLITYYGRGENIAGVSDLGEIGIKRQFGPYKRFVSSLVGSLSTPTGNAALVGSGVKAQFRMPYAIALTEKVAFCGMQSLTFFDSARIVSYQPFVMVTRSFGKRARTAAFIEYAGFFNTHLPNAQVAHFGGIHRLNRNNQIDLHFGFGLDRSAPSALIGVGYSYRFDRLPW